MGIWIFWSILLNQVIINVDDETKIMLHYYILGHIQEYVDSEVELLEATLEQTPLIVLIAVSLPYHRLSNLEIINYETL